MLAQSLLKLKQLLQLEPNEQFASDVFYKVSPIEVKMQKSQLNENMVAQTCQALLL